MRQLDSVAKPREPAPEEPGLPPGSPRAGAARKKEGGDGAAEARARKLALAVLTSPFDSVMKAAALGLGAPGAGVGGAAQPGARACPIHEPGVLARGATLLSTLLPRGAEGVALLRRLASCGIFTAEQLAHCLCARRAPPAPRARRSPGRPASLPGDANGRRSVPGH